jgi:hypothetical protein
MRGVQASGSGGAIGSFDAKERFAGHIAFSCSGRGSSLGRPGADAPELAGATDGTEDEKSLCLL